MLADLVHHVRHSLTLPQLTHMVSLYTRTLHDASLPLSIQTMSAKLLVNIIDSLRRSEPARSEGRCTVTHVSTPTQTHTHTHTHTHVHSYTVDRTRARTRTRTHTHMHPTSYQAARGDTRVSLTLWTTVGD
jgi:hypothetical protein